MMDSYTIATKNWLDERFKKHDKRGIYTAHQPIYGFRKGHCEPGLMEKYIRTYQIMKALSHLKFNSLLDVGGAEGYKSYIAREIFKVTVRNSDLSEEACKRASEIFKVESDQVDVHNLPYADNQFDVLLCSETLEHVSDFKKALKELLRVAHKAVVITVPHEPDEVVKRNIDENIIHGHINKFDLESFTFLQSKGYKIIKKKIASRLLYIHSLLIGADSRNLDRIQDSNFLVNMHNNLLPIIKRLFNKKAAAFLVELDAFICNFTNRYDAILFVILKNTDCYRKSKSPKLSALKIINFEVPYHYLKIADFRYEEIRFYAYDSLQPGTLPVYRFYNTVTEEHFYTISEVERDTVIENHPQFNYEGIGFYAYDSLQPGTLPVHR